MESTQACPPLTECLKCKNPPHATKCQCRLRTYKEGKKTCGKGKTPHHLVPDHCFKQPGEDGQYYKGAVEHSEGLCVCVTGATKATGQHKRVHRKFDARESALGKAGKPPNSATLGQLEDAAAESVAAVTKCDPGDLKTQLRTHHKDLEPDTRLRADPWGRRKSPPYAKMGKSNQGTFTGT